VVYGVAYPHVFGLLLAGGAVTIFLRRRLRHLA
jgi:hypothetical protein